MRIDEQYVRTDKLIKSFTQFFRICSHSTHYRSFTQFLGEQLRHIRFRIAEAKCILGGGVLGRSTRRSKFLVGSRP